MKNTFIITMLLFLASCASQKELTTNSYNMWVKGVKVDCTGVGPMKCFQVQKSDKIIPGKWQIFYGNIEGFQFIGGNLYKIRVSEQKIPKMEVPADGSSLKYKLVEVLESLPDPIFELHDIWVLDAIENKSIQSPGNNSVLITPSIEINITEMKIMGTDGCNQFFGPIKNADEGILEFGDLGSTMKMCINMEIPDTFNKAMAQVKKYKRDGLKLYLLNESGADLLTFKKVD